MTERLRDLLAEWLRGQQMKKSLIFIIGLAVATVAYVISKELVRYLMKPSYSTQQQAVREGFQKAVQLLKDKIPQRIDEITTLIDVQNDDLTLQYHYSLNIDQSALPSDFSANLKKDIISKMCVDKNFTVPMNYGATYRYIYFDRQSQPIYAIIISKGECEDRQK